MANDKEGKPPLQGLIVKREGLFLVRVKGTEEINGSGSHLFNASLFYWNCKAASVGRSNREFFIRSHLSPNSSLIALPLVSN